MIDSTAYYKSILESDGIDYINRIIYFDTYIEDNAITNLIKHIDALNGIDELTPIKLFINSGGGNGYQMLRYYDAIRRMNAKIDTYVEGYASSGASFMSICTTGRRYMTENSHIQIHKPNVELSDQNLDSNKLKMAHIEKLNEKIMKIYASYTKVKDWDEIINKSLNFFSAKESLENGFVDEIIKIKTIQKFKIKKPNGETSSNRTA
jgi:ATP-dependent Clp protease protease subunit